MIQAFPLPPCLSCGVTIFDEMPGPFLCVRLTVKDVADAKGVPKTPNERVNNKKDLIQNCRRGKGGKDKQVHLEEYDRRVGDAMEINVLKSEEIVHIWRLLNSRYCG